MKKIKAVLFLLVIQTGISFAQTAGNALNFNASNGYVSAGLPSVFSNIPSNDFTIEAWVKPVTNSTTKRLFFAQLNTSNFVSILINSSNVAYVFVIHAGTTTSVNTQTVLTSGEWSHFAVSWDASTSSIVCYINGTQTSNITGGSSSTGTDNLMTIGSRTDGNQIFNGAIDELRIWDVIRTQCEIQGSMNSEFTSSQPNLIAYYKFNQGVAGGTNTTETTLNEFNTAYNGTLNGFLLTGTSSNWVSSGAGVTVQNANDATIHLTDVQTACSSYTWIDNNTYTASNNTATYNSTSPAGCPIVEQLDLTINYPTTGTDVVTVCESYTWIDNNTYTASNNTATHTISGGAANGCDSTVTLNLTIHNSTAGTDVISACESYTWIDNNTYTASNNSATYTITGGTATGCDSIVTLDLTIHNSTSGTDIITACDSYLWIDNNTYTASNNTATYTIVGGAANGCDSIVQLDLTIETIDLSVTNTGLTITANETGASYQWVDCDNGNAPIAGATNQSFTATANGNYAVMITKGSCSEVSNCTLINSVGLSDLSEETFRIYPNPNDGQFNVSFSSSPYDQTIMIHNALGEKILEQKAGDKTIQFQLNLDAGYYYVSVGNTRLPFVIK